MRFGESVAIIGMAIRFPGLGEEGELLALNEKEYFEFLLEQKSAFSSIPEQRWSFQTDEGAPMYSYTSKGAFLPETDLFDASFFNLSMGEAATLDPQQRLLMELSWHALEDAGLTMSQVSEIVTGVYVGSSNDDYRLCGFDTNAHQVNESSAFIGNLRSALAGRIAYTMNLHGPAMSLDSSCSTALLAVHTACRALQTGDCEIALAGAANLLLHPSSWYGLCASGALSHAGQCRPFDHAADGYVRGEGGGIFVLMRLKDALDKGLRIRGVIRGSAVNHDGASNGMTAPNGKAQEAVIRQALYSAGVDAKQIGYIEAHGTGTRLGDPVEVSALARIFQKRGDKDRVLLGTTKGAVGHLESAAGCASLAKLILAGENRKIPGVCGVEHPSSLIPWQRLSLSLLQQTQDWPEDEAGALLAGVSAFGMSGTNVHLIFEPASTLSSHSIKTVASHFEWNDPLASQVIPVTAQDDIALNELTQVYAQILNTIPAAACAVAAQSGRTPLRQRSVLLTHSTGQVRKHLQASNAVSAGSKNLVWLFTGQGAQYPQMGHDICAASHMFRETMECCLKVASPIAGCDLQQVLFGDELSTAERATQLKDTALAQPSLYAIQAGLIDLWRYYGIVPDVMIGHSVGEIALAYASGVFSLEDGARLAAKRGQLMKTHCLEAGGMMAVMAPYQQVENIIAPYSKHLCIAAYNAPEQCVLAGDLEIMKAAQEIFDQVDIDTAALSVSHAFHSPFMAAMENEFADFLADFPFSHVEEEKGMFISTVTGCVESINILAKPQYWLKHLLSPVRFEQAIRTALHEKPDVFMEIGAKPILSGLALQVCMDVDEQHVPVFLPSLDAKRQDREVLAETLGGLFNCGIDIKWPKSEPAFAACLLPKYPFQCQTFWWDSEQTKHDQKGYQLYTPSTELQKANHATPSVLSVHDELMNIWRKWLPVSKFTQNDDFFMLGGNSLIASQIVREVQRHFDHDFSMTRFLGCRTVALLEAELSHKNTTQEIQDWELNAIATASEKRYEPFALNDMQYAYWIGRQVYFDSEKIGIHAYFEIERQHLDVIRFKQAWQALLERHDMLRAIVRDDGQQIVLKEIPFYEIVEKDLSQWCADDYESYLLESRRKLEHKCYDLASWPQFDLHIYKLPENVFRIHLCLDGWSVDGWSYQVLFKDLLDLYTNPDTVLPPITFTFRDYVCALNGIEASSRYLNDLSYWQKRVIDLPLAPELPLNHDQKNADTSCFARKKGTISGHEWKKIKDKAAQIGISTATLMLSIYADVLSCWAASPRFTINVPRFNRLPLHDDINHLIGEFASFTLLEIERKPAQNFIEFAQSVQAQLWRDLDHGLVSGVRVLRELNQYRKSAQNIIMPYVFTMAPEQLENGQVRSAMLPLSRLGKVIYSLTETPQVWLDCQYVEYEDQIEYFWDVVDGMYPASMIEEMFACYSNTLKQLANDEQAWYKDNLIQLPPKQAQRRKEVNATAHQQPQGSYLDYLTQQVQTYPQNIAVISEGVSYTYQDLDQQIRTLAFALQQAGVNAKDRVAILQPKGWHQIVSVWAILAVGATYVPLDHKSPEQRIKHMITDAQVALTLTLSHDIQAPTGASVNVDQINEQTKQLKAFALRQAEDLTYIIYTSGSTGEPKGVMVKDQGVLNAIHATQRRLTITPQDKIFGISALHHDMSVYDTLGGICAGATLIIPSAHKDRDATHWLDQVQQHQVTFWSSVPAMMEMLLTVAQAQTEKDAIGKHLKWALLGGDWLPVTLPERLKTQAPNCQLVSVGGPTETTMWNIMHVVKEKDSQAPSIPYGQPIDNTQYYIMDELGRERPDYAIGQMYCAGAGVSAGYWNKEEQTVQKYTQHPQTGQRIYATGDLGSWLPTGEIRFIGRADGQVKINGMRIETAEIESVLQRHPKVKEAAVVVGDHPQGHSPLYAFVVSDVSILEDRFQLALTSAFAKTLDESNEVLTRWEEFHAVAEKTAILAMVVALQTLSDADQCVLEDVIERYPSAAFYLKTLRQWHCAVSRTGYLKEGAVVDKV